MIEKLTGYKTYICLAMTMGWVLIYLKAPGAKDAIGTDNFQAVLALLLTGAGVAFKAGHNRIESALAPGPGAPLS